MGTKKSKKKISAKLGCLLIFLILFCIGLWGYIIVTLVSDKGSQEGNSQNEEVKEASGEDMQSQVEAIILDILGDKTNYGEQTISDLQVNDHKGTSDEQDKIIIATIRGNENLTTDLTRKGMLVDSVELFKELFALEKSQEVTLIWQYPLTDTNGNTNNDTILKISFDRDSASNINWDSFDKENLKNVANEYWEHAAMQN